MPKTAMRVFGVEKAEDVTPNMRRQAKAVNFELSMVSVIMACPKT